MNLCYSCIMNTGEKVGIAMIAIGLLIAVFPIGIFRAIQSGRIPENQGMSAVFYGLMLMFLGVALIGFGLAVKFKYAGKK